MTKTQNIPRITILSLVLFFFGLQIALAQPQHHRNPQQRAARHLEKMTEELDLTAVQINQVQAIHEKYGPKMNDLFEAGTAGEMDHAKMKALHQAQQKEVKAILSPEQQAKMETLHRKHGRHPGEMGPESHLSMHGPGNPEMRAYMQAHVMPVIKAQRNKLEAKLTNADKASIAQMRTELQRLRPAHKAAQKSRKALRKSGEKPTAIQISQRKALREQRQSILDKAAIIADKYQTEIDALHQEIKPQAETWHREMHALMQQHSEGKAHPESCKKACHGPKDKIHHKMKTSHFLLMDPNAPMMDETLLDIDEEKHVLYVYPNPTANSNRIRYEVKTPGNVRLQLITKDGHIIRELLNSHHEAGTYSLDVETSNLKTDVYYYRITDTTGPRVKRFSITK
ncbi:MAG TPA: T9SS type A sorting domain-containing protein [Bacteroidetes bacterium]|nr:T9SS type A sorting domain-containing protein [Bacteroidota bacterium]